MIVSPFIASWNSDLPSGCVMSDSNVTCNQIRHALMRFSVVSDEVYCSARVMMYLSFWRAVVNVVICGIIILPLICHRNVLVVCSHGESM